MAKAFVPQSAPQLGRGRPDPIRRRCRPLQSLYVRQSESLLALLRLSAIAMPFAGAQGGRRSSIASKVWLFFCRGGPESSRKQLGDIALGPPPLHRRKNSATPTAKDQCDFLSNSDTVFLVDDSASMVDRLWKEASKALAPICATYGSRGVEIKFMSQADIPGENPKTVVEVERLFSSARREGKALVGTALNSTMERYLQKCEEMGTEDVKPLNIVVMTAGCSNDDHVSAIRQAVRRLEKMKAPSRQIGFQFFQLGRTTYVFQELKGLNDIFYEEGRLEDTVVMVPWRERLDAQSMLKLMQVAFDRRPGYEHASGDLPAGNCSPAYLDTSRHQIASTTC